MTSRAWQWAAVATVVLASFVLFLYGLGAAPLQDYDEATYAQVTREELQSGNWLSFTHTGSEYFEKPPLTFWFEGVSEKLLGDNEFALRLPSALCGIALVLVVMLFAYELGESLWAAALAGAIVLTMSPVVETARQVRIDGPMTLWIVLAAYAFVRGLQNPRWFLLFGLAAGLAVLTKDVIAFFAFAAALTFALWLPSAGWRINWLKEKYFWWGIVVCMVVTLPWHIYETLQFGVIFWQEYIGFDVVTRSTQDIFMIQNTNAEYVQFLGMMAAPWTQLFIFLIAGLVVYWKMISPNLRRSAAACASTVAIVFVVFFVAKTKAPTYLLPLYPFAAIFIGLILQAIGSNIVSGYTNFLLKIRSGFAPSRCRVPATMLLPIAVVILLLVGLGSTIYNGFHFNPYFRGPDELAREEKIVGQLVAQNDAANLYAFDDTNLGSIMYYSHHTHPLGLGDGAVAGSFIVLPTSDIAAVSELYPSLATQTLYTGKQITLLLTGPALEAQA